MARGRVFVDADGFGYRPTVWSSNARQVGTLKCAAREGSTMPVNDQFKKSRNLPWIVSVYFGVVLFNSKGTENMKVLKVGGWAIRPGVCVNIYLRITGVTRTNNFHAPPHI